MTSFRTLVVVAVLFSPTASFAAKVVKDCRMPQSDALAWVAANEGVLNAAKSSATVKVYTIKGGEIVIDDMKPESVHFQLVKN